MNEEKCKQLIAEIISGNDRGDFNDPARPAGNYNYGHLLALLYMQGRIDGARELFKSLYDYAIAAGKNFIAQKAAQGERIRVFFLSYSAAEFPAEGVYRLLKEDERFETKIMLVPLTDRSREDSLDTYKKSRKSFDAKGYDFFDTWNTRTNALMTWHQMGGYPDIMIHTSSWNQCIAEPYRIEHCPFTTLNGYIPYGMSYILNSPDGEFSKTAFTIAPFMSIVWRNFACLPFEKEEFEKLNILKGKNTVVTGYPKMDYIVEHKNQSSEVISKLWRIWYIALIIWGKNLGNRVMT